jgi:hypothetical protein
MGIDGTLKTRKYWDYNNRRNACSKPRKACRRDTPLWRVRSTKLAFVERVKLNLLRQLKISGKPKSRKSSSSPPAAANIYTRSCIDLVSVSHSISPRSLSWAYCKCSLDSFAAQACNWTVELKNWRKATERIPPRTFS